MDDRQKNKKRWYFILILVLTPFIFNVSTKGHEKSSVSFILYSASQLLAFYKKKLQEMNYFLLGFPTEITYFYEWVSYFRDVKLPKFKS